MIDRARILVVDDESSVLWTVQRILENRHEVRTTESPSAAVSLAREFHPHLAILDVRMPEMDGFQLMTELKTIDSDLDVILMTGSVYDTDQKLIRAIRERAFYYIMKPFDREVLLTLINRWLTLKNLELANRIHRDHLQEQLESARSFQKSILARDRAHIEGFDIRAGYYPCAEVAGDFYDYAAAGPGQVSVLIADVVGHGASAAMLTAIVKLAFRRAKESGYSPQTVAENLAKDMEAFSTRQFVTLLCARISASRRVLEYVNAGHDGGVLLAGEANYQTLDSTAPFVNSVFAGQAWEMRHLPWQSDSRLLLYSDGIIEAQGPDDMFGHHRLLASARSGVGKDADLLARIYRDLIEHLSGNPQTDDVTLLTVSEAGGQ
jgi:sigma-B regulation protein RsbU (phosphoserine phosphatase)